MQIFSQALNTTALSGTYGRAAALAEAGLGLVGLDIPLEPGLLSGEAEDGLQWRIQVVEMVLGDLVAWEAPLPAFLVTSEVACETGRGTRSISLSTLRLGDERPEN